MTFKIDGVDSTDGQDRVIVDQPLFITRFAGLSSGLTGSTYLIRCDGDGAEWIFGAESTICYRDEQLAGLTSESPILFSSLCLAAA